MPGYIISRSPPREFLNSPRLPRAPPTHLESRLDAGSAWPRAKGRGMPGKRDSGAVSLGEAQADPTSRRHLRHALGNPRQPRGAVELRAGLTQSKGAGLLPSAESAFWGRKPSVAERHGCGERRWRGAENGWLGCFDPYQDHMNTPSNY